MSIAVALFVHDRAHEELALLKYRLSGADPGSATVADLLRLRESARGRAEACDQYLRMVWAPATVAQRHAGRAHELLRTLCLMARLDAAHADYATAMEGCTIDCGHPFW